MFELQKLCMFLTYTLTKNNFLTAEMKKIELISVCPKTRCLDGKIQFRGVIVRFTGVNERLLFFDTTTKMEFSAKH